jgi:serine/threonine-protein kinase
MSSLNDFVTERAATRVGAVLRGKWKLERIIGVGGMATVYAATHRNQSRVAIKVLHPEVSLDADVTARFLREGYVANVIDHFGTVKVLDDDVTEDGAPFLVMELLEGETVDARWERKLQRLPISEVLAIGDQILDVLAAAHDKGVVHRDLKPENLFLTRNGELRVLDFGIARLREVSSETSTQTRAEALLGTPAFMAPERRVAAGKKWTPAPTSGGEYALHVDRQPLHESKPCRSS